MCTHPKKRCENCKKVLINGSVVGGVAQIQCENCKHKNIVVADVIEMQQKVRAMSKVG